MEEFAGEEVRFAAADQALERAARRAAADGRSGYRRR
jgi:hypothetical protein